MLGTIINFVVMVAPYIFFFGLYMYVIFLFCSRLMSLGKDEDLDGH